MYREPVNRNTNFVFPSKTSRYGFFTKITRSDVLFTRYENGFVSSSVFRSAAQKNVSRTSEPKHKFCSIIKNLLEVTSCLHDTKTVSSVRVFFLAQRRKMYREPVNGSTNFVFNQKLLDTLRFASLLEVTFVESKLFNTINHANIIRLHITLFR